MIADKGIQVTILAGAGGPAYECFRSTGSARTEIIRSEAGAPICPRLTITSAFEWYDADMLSVEVHFGTAKALQPRRVTKPADGRELVIELDKWVVWSPERNEFLSASFKFCDIKWDKTKEPRWSEDKRTNFGIITISIQRMTNDGHDVAYQWDKIAFEPLLKIGSGALIACGIEQTICISKFWKISETERRDLGTATRLDGRPGERFKFKFPFKSRNWLESNSNDRLEPSDYLTAGNCGLDTRDQSQETADVIGENSAGKKTEPRGRRWLRQAARRGRKSAVKQSSSSIPGSAPGGNVAGNRKSESISTTASGARTVSTSQQGRPSPATVSTMGPLDRAEKIHMLKEEDAALDTEIIQRLQARQAKVRQELLELEKDA